jgi:hypothetical protein
VRKKYDVIFITDVCRSRTLYVNIIALYSLYSHTVAQSPKH